MLMVLLFSNFIGYFLGTMFGSLNRTLQLPIDFLNFFIGVLYLPHDVNPISKFLA